MSEANMTISPELDADMREANNPTASKEEDDLEEGECSDEDEELLESNQPVVDDDHEQVEKDVDENELAVEEETHERSKHHKEEKKEKKHKRRSRSESRERNRSRKHKKKKGKDREKEKQREREDDEEDEATKKKSMLKRLKALEGEMGLVESEEEEEVASSGDSSPSPDKEKKRKRDKSEKDRGRKKWKGPETRPCNLYLQGKCPRDETECLFSHDVELPQVWELCKFYVYDRCVKKDKCLYLHKGFPCKFHHLGMDCQNDAISCKFSHDPLNETTRSLLLKHVESAPKELLGDFPRLTRQEATRAIWNTAAKNSGWTIPDNNTRVKPNTRWDRSMETNLQTMQHSVTMEGGLPSDMNIYSRMPSQSHELLNEERSPGANWSGGPQGAGRPSPKMLSGLMEVKLNEKVIQQFLSDQIKDNDDNVGEGTSGGLTTDDVDPWNRDGDETPEITPPVSPAGDIQSNEMPNIPKTFQYQRNQQVNANTVVTRNDSSEYCQNNDYYSDDENSCAPNVSNVSQESAYEENDETGPVTDMAKADPYFRSSMGHSSDSKFPPLADNTYTKKGEKKDPRLHKTDPRKERQAKREEEERLEKEKDKRILELDLGSVFGDLELPPLIQSPKQTDEEKQISDKFGLPFKPHIFHVAKEMDGSIHSHAPMQWFLIPVDVPERDYSHFKHRFSSSQIELDPRLRRIGKSTSTKMKDLPSPSISVPKTDPRLKGRVDPRRGSHSDNRRSSEDSEGNPVYNPARELNKGRNTSQVHHKMAPEFAQPMERSSPCNYREGPQSRQGQHQDADQFHFQSDDVYYDSQEVYDINPDEYDHANEQYGEKQQVDSQDSMNPRDGANNFPPSHDLSYHQMQISMGLLKGMQNNMEAMLNKEGGDPRLNSFSGGRPRFNQSSRFPSGGPPSIRGFSTVQSGANRGQWTPRFGRGESRGRPDFINSHRGTNMSLHRTKDPRVKF